MRDARRRPHEASLGGGAQQVGDGGVKGYLSDLYKGDNVRCFPWTQGVALEDVTPYAKATTERIPNNARQIVTEAGRPVISSTYVKMRNRQQNEDLARSIAERDGVTEAPPDGGSR